MPELTRLGAIGTDELGSLHRDLLEPPAHDGRPHLALNFVMTADGRVKIADFGIAKATNQNADGRVSDRHGHDGRDAELVEVGDLVGDQPQRQADGAALPEGIDPKSRQAFPVEGEVECRLPP